jgi:3D (Asp-Asp-Asp) domain-containing protein
MASNFRSPTRTSLALSLMFLGVLLAGSDCQQSEAHQWSQSSRTSSGGQQEAPDRSSYPSADEGSVDHEWVQGPVDGEQTRPSPGATETGPDENLTAGGCVDDSHCAQQQDCVAGTCVESGPLRISMIWSVPTDLDLHILTPGGEHLWYRNRESADGGRLTSDTCIGGACESDGRAFVESAHWRETPTRGEYTFWAVNYAGQTAASVAFEVLIDGVLTSFSSTVGSAQSAQSEPIVIAYPATQAEELAPGTPIGDFVHTYYYLAEEENYSGSASTTLYDAQCRPLASVSASFSDSICIEGSGKLRDGKVLNYASRCSCGRPCPTGGTVCYSVVDPNLFPWGKGNRNNPLEPFRSVAVDRNVIANGTILYIEQWDGVAIPSVNGLGGFTHDGCFRADDVGGAVRGRHYDFFAGTRAMWRALEPIRPTRTSSKVYVDSPRCAHLR